MSSSGIRQMIQRRAREAEIPTSIRTRCGTPARIRCSAATRRTASRRASESDVMQLGGWRIEGDASRYAAATAEARALETARRSSPGDRL